MMKRAIIMRNGTERWSERAAAGDELTAMKMAISDEMSSGNDGVWNTTESS